MENRRGYLGLDRFRIIAALLVVAIHTSPLLSLGVLPDVMFTRILARLGVPFFLAVTGFFLLAPGQSGEQPGIERVLGFVRKIAIVYGISILLYLPVNLYAGHLNEVRSFGQVLKLVLVDGTMYHLWYLPAALFGVVLVWLLLRFGGLKGATMISGALYAVGLFGDSYYGLAEAVPPLEALYQGIFFVSNYTRNGLFYVPIFLLMGVWAAKRQAWPRGKSLIGFGVSMLLMLGEGLALFAAGTQRHDSMYILLPICVFSLVCWLSTFRGEPVKAFRDLSLLVYIIHPGVIVVLRGVAKPLGLEPLLIGNSIVHYVVVCVISFALAGTIVWFMAQLPKGRRRRKAPKRARMEVDLIALKHNVQVLRELLPGSCKLMPAIKGNAYGFGALQIAKALYLLNVRDFCVASLAEGIALRKGGVRGNILILGYTYPDDCSLARKYKLTQTVVDYAHGVKLAEKGLHLQVHIKVDTGMHRLGERSNQIDNICEMFSLKGLKIKGIFTQLPCCDSKNAEDIVYTRAQIQKFRDLTNTLKQRGFALPETHVQCSYGIINYRDIQADYARPGLALYGIVDEACCLQQVPGLEPVFEVKTHIALIKHIYKGERVGYGNVCIAKRDMRIAVITMGYADGLPRCLSGGVGKVLVHGQYAPIVGSICMDQAMIDVSHIENAGVGDTAVVIGHSGGAAISVNEFAEWAGTIPNEIVSRLGERLEREYSWIPEREPVLKKVWTGKPVRGSEIYRR